MTNARSTGLYHLRDVYHDICDWSSFEPYLSFIENITIKVLFSLIRDIPQFWYGDHHQLRWMLVQLYERRLLLRELIAGCIGAHPDYFPHWRFAKSSDRRRIAPQSVKVQPIRVVEA